MESPENQENKIVSAAMPGEMNPSQDEGLPPPAESGASPAGLEEAVKADAPMAEPEETIPSVGGVVEAQPEIVPAEPRSGAAADEISQPETAPAEGKAEEEVRGEKRWYVIQTFTGQEDKVKQAIELTIESEQIGNRVFQVLVPTEETVEIKGGKRYEKVKKMFPGYVFLEMILDEKSWYLIRQTAGVARFIGTKVTPTPVSDKEMQRVLKQLGKEERLEIHFEKGEGVRVISGPFRGYTGTVDEINAEKGKLKVLINIFGRDTPVEVNFEHAQKIA
jgi:transcriptional antiterminator NusG